MAPILKRLYDKNGLLPAKLQKWAVEEELDLYKADIFSFGLILYEAATGKSIS